MQGSLAPGAVLAGRYEIRGELDRGGHGAVYRAVQKPLGREVAIKVMLPEVAAGPGMSERFAREVSLVQRLEHPNTVRLYDFGSTDDGTAFMVFELLRGRSLESEMQRGPMPAARVAKIVVQILKSLMEAHALGIVHRDVKPANVLLVDYSGEPDFVKVLDFGVARPMGATARAITRDGQIVGTPAYMAPEQVRDEPITPRTDLYSLGLVMGEMLAGGPIFDGTSAAQIWMQQASAAPVPVPERARASLLGGVVERATRKDPQARFGSAQEMIDAIEGAVRAQGLAPTDALAPPLPMPMPSAGPPRSAPTAPFVSAPPPRQVTSVLPPQRRHAPGLGELAPWQRGVIVAAGIFMAAAMMGATAWHRWRGSSAPEQPTPLGPVVLEPGDMPSVFLVRRKAVGRGWSVARVQSGDFKEGGGDCHYETYEVKAPAGAVAYFTVVRLPDEEAAERYAARMSDKPLKAFRERFVLYQQEERITPFAREAFNTFTR